MMSEKNSALYVVVHRFTPWGETKASISANGRWGEVWESGSFSSGYREFQADRKSSASKKSARKSRRASTDRERVGWPPPCRRLPRQISAPAPPQELTRPHS